MNNDEIRTAYEREAGPYQRPPVTPQAGMGRTYRIIIIVLYVSAVVTIIGLLWTKLSTL